MTIGRAWQPQTLAVRPLAQYADLMDPRTSTPILARQVRLHKAALWQAGVALLFAGFAFAGNNAQSSLVPIQGVLVFGAVAGYVLLTFTIYRLAVAQGYGSARAAGWLFLLAPLASFVALVLLKPIVATRPVRSSTVGGA